MLAVYYVLNPSIYVLNPPLFRHTGVPKLSTGEPDKTNVILTSFSVSCELLLELCVSVGDKYCEGVRC
jgi:hypothetical protein